MERIKGLIGPVGKYNLHTHPVYCDGKDTPAEMAKAAYDRGFQLLGFSGHGFAPHDLDVCMTKEKEEQYRSDVLALKEEYAGRLDIRLGKEQDFYADDSTAETGMEPPADFPYDYLIGSVHYVKKDGVYMSVDDTAEIMERAVEEHFRGSVRDYVECYFETESQVLIKTKADIVGHFDLVCKFNDTGRYFDESAPWYRDCAIAAIDRIAAAPSTRRSGIADFLGDGGKPVFEINLGAMAKGYRSIPYPSAPLLARIQELGCPIVLSSDCHDARKLDYKMDEFEPLQ